MLRDYKNKEGKSSIIMVLVIVTIFSCTNIKTEKNKFSEKEVTIGLIKKRFSERELYNELKIREALSNKKIIRDTIPRNDTLKQLPDEKLYVSLKEKQIAIYGIYGSDNRVDIYNIKDAKILHDARTVVALLKKDQLKNNNDGTYTINTGKSFSDYFGLCNSERFGKQPCEAFCSGFAAGKRLIVTAGHCIVSENLKDLYFVFGYTMENESRPNLIIPDSDVYEGVQIIDTALHNPYRNDFAIIKVNKDIPANRIASIRTRGKISDNDEVHVIGHPSGLPMKFADSAFVRDNSISNYFITNLDTYGGNSGSPVFNRKTHVVEGILVRGGQDFIQVGNCSRSVICPMSDCRGEDVSRTSQFAQKIK